MANETETGTETETKEQTPAEIAAAEKLALAEARAAEAESEAARLKAEKDSGANKGSHPKGGYALSAWTDAEWAEQEARTGRDRKDLLTEINLRLDLKNELKDSAEAMTAKYAVKEELQDALDADHLSPKYKAEVKKFMADIPGDLLRDPETRKKWINKAIAYGKSQVKLPTTGRKLDTMDTKETGTIKDKSADKGFSIEEKEVIESHGRTVDDYSKMQSHIVKDGTVHKYKDEAPTFNK